MIATAIQRRVCWCRARTTRCTCWCADQNRADRPSCSRLEWVPSRRTGIGCSRSLQRRSEALRTIVRGLAGAGRAGSRAMHRRLRSSYTMLYARRTYEPPYVLAGHSFGGLPVRAFADLYPELTAGLVLVDASHPDQWVRWPTPRADRILELSQRLFGWLGWFGLLRTLNLTRGISAGLPAQQVAELRAGAALPGFAATEAAQMRSWSVSRQQLSAAQPLGNLPLAVLTVSEQPRGGELLRALQTELAELTQDASFEVVQGASHESLVSDRENARVVAQTILAVVQAARDRERATSTEL